MGIFSKIERRWPIGQTNQTGTEFLGRVKNTNEYLNILYPALAPKGKKDLMNYISDCKSYNKKVLEQYVDFLSEHNGAVLYSGGIVMFGSTRYNEPNYFVYPTSIMYADKNDYVSSRLNRVLYIGNALHKSGGNINFYLNLENGIVSGYIKEEIIISWKNIRDFFEFIYIKYDSMYNEDGTHKFFNEKEKNVYRNIQLFDEV